MSRFGKVFLKTGIPFGLMLGALCVPLGFVMGWTWGLLLAVVVAVISGVPFGLFMAAFATSKGVKDSVTPVFAAGEIVIMEGPANHFVGIEGVGGWLYLTGQRLVFKSHWFNIQVHELSVPLSEIASVEAVMTLGIIPNGLKVITRGGTGERFVVEGRKEWERQIVGQLREHGGDGAEQAAQRDASHR